MPELGLVGDPLPSRAAPRSLERARRGLVPVVSPLARGPLNVNADEAAAALALGLGADADPLPHRRPRRLPRRRARRTSIDARDARSRCSTAAFDGGIVPKLLAAAVARARRGVAAEIGVTAVVA